MGYGVNENVYTDWISYIFFDRDKAGNTCEITVMDYPGWYYGVDEMESKATCEEYNWNYNDMWYRFIDGNVPAFRVE